MLVRSKKGWELPESAATPESVYLARRDVIKALGMGTILAAGATLGVGSPWAAETADPSASLYPMKRNPRYTLDRDLTEEKFVTSYNNFYEFGSQKDIVKPAQALPIRPWTIRIDGMVEKERTVDIDDLLKQMPLEERLYRHRCVEAWAMAVPWSGFPMKAFVDFARPLGSAKYVRTETFLNKDVAPGQRATWQPWPYIEGLTVAEATNEMAFLATGIYGKPMPKQNGSPIRLAAPWKYGFKSSKSLVRFTFTDRRPTTFWEMLGPNEYGFWANVNPQVPHPRWSQAEERVLGKGTFFSPEMVPTKIYNGYGEYVAHLYANVSGEKLFM